MTVTATSSALRVDDEGLLLREAGTEPLVLRFDDRYIWAFSPVRDGVPRGSGVLVEWPPVLRRFLHGPVRVGVTSVDGDRVVGEVETVLGADDLDSPDAADRPRVAVVDPQGLPLAIDKVGHLCRAFDATDDRIRDEILTGTRRVLDDLTDACGVPAYLSYGALLGAVRDGAMIAHDSDTDVCYLSAHSSPADVITESYAIERTLRRRGWNLLRMSGGDIKVLLPLSDGRQCHVDIFVAFRVEGVFYQLGNRSGRLPTSAVLPLSTIELHGVEFPAPADPEAMLAFVYGPTWRVPDPSFRYADPVAGVRRLDGWLRGFRTDMPLWTEFYATGRAQRLRRSSGFARWVDRRVPAGEPIADLGCGLGRDSLWFASARGRPVRAYDFCRPARGQLARRVARRGHRVRVGTLILNELRSVLLTGAELAREPHHLYARQLLGCLDDDARANLWRLARMALRRGGALYLEFSADPALPAPEPAGLVRRLDVDDVRRQIEAAGGLVTKCRVRPGVDMLDHPDPAVCRMRVTWSGTRRSPL